LDSVIERRSREITAILQEVSVPLLDHEDPATRGAPHGTPSGSVAPTRDTVRDSLLVSDSIYQGWKWFHVYCFRCHGEDAQHPVIATAPDLRWVLSKSGMAYPRDSFEYTVLNGRPDKVVAALAAATAQAPADFSGKDLSGLDLSGIDFKRANLSRCRLVKTNLARAQLFSVTLSDAIATEADFTAAQLDASVMYRVDMRHAILRDASLFAVIAYDADFSDADLTRARIISPMSHARFARATLSHANLGADPGNQSMGVMRTDASGADFTGADLSGAN